MSRQSSPRILLSGYFGFENPGDEAILQASIEGFKAALLNENPELIVLSNNPELTAVQYQVKALPRRDYLKIIRALKPGSLFLSGGGGLLQDKTSLKSLLYYLGLILLARLRGAKTMVFAQGIGPINSKAGKGLTSFILNLTHRITVREEASQQFLQKIGVKQNITVTADPAFNLKSAPKERIEEILAKENLPSSPQKEKIAFSLRSWENDRKLPEIFAQTAAALAKEFNLHPVFIPFQPDQDYKICEKTWQLGQTGSLLKGKYLPSELLGIFSQMKITLGMRLHSLIFSAINQVPALGIAYDPKVENFLKLVNLPCLPLKDLTAESLTQKARQLYLKNLQYRESLQNQTPSLQEKARENINLALQTWGLGISGL